VVIGIELVGSITTDCSVLSYCQQVVDESSVPVLDLQLIAILLRCGCRQEYGDK